MEKQSLPDPSLAAMEKQSLPDLWTAAQKRFRDKTGKVLEFSPPKTLEDVCKQIESQQADFSTKDKGLKEKAEDATMNALNCLKLLGGVAAQGASMVS
jgi:hypothetical protein